MLLLLVTAASCNKDKTNEMDGDWLFPIAKGNLSINSLSELKNLEYDVEIPAFSIGQPVNFPVSSPGLHISHVGPFGVQITDWLHRVDVDTLEFTGSLSNFFPIPIGAGTRVSLRNARDTSAAHVVGFATIPQTVMPGASFSFDINIYGQSLSDSVYFTLDEFNSPAYNNVVFSSTPAHLKIQLKVVAASFVEIYTNRTFTSVDTAEFSAGEDDNIGGNSGGALSDTSTSGVINVFTDNGLPANIYSQLYFLDETKTQVLDSMFLGALDMEGGLTDDLGNTSFINRRKTIIPVTRQKLDHLKASRYVASRFEFNTVNYTGLWVAANRGPKLSIQFTGDLNIRINF